MLNMTGKVVLITGAASGIGKEAARVFTSHGAKVVVADYDIEKAIQVAHDLKYNAIAVQVDVADQESCENAIQSALRHFGKIDVLINNAGITRDASFKKMTLEQWQAVIDVNLTGVFNMTKAVIDHMVENKQGRIINTSSVVRNGNFGQGNYSSTKAGLVGLTKTLAKEYGRKGITVNAVAPGFIATDMTKAMPENVLEGMRKQVPMQRLGDPQEIANAYLFLASDLATYVNGTVLEVDGGLVV